MLQPKVCPDCGQGLKPNITHCKCGWELVVLQTKSQPLSQNVDKRPKQDLQCGYRHFGIRCPLPGTVTATLGPKALFYCTGYLGRKGHLQTLDYPDEALEILRFNQEHYLQIMDEYRNSRRRWSDLRIETEIQKQRKALGQLEGADFDPRKSVLKWAAKQRSKTSAAKQCSLSDAMSQLKIFNEEK